MSDQKKCIIICDGELPLKETITAELFDADLLIAADGGAFALEAMNILPDVIIGDLDSYQATGNEQARVIKDPDQETNDLEKSLAYAERDSADHIVVFGATGKRLDHTLKNLSVLLQFHSRFNQLVFKDRYSTMEIISSPFKRNFGSGTSLSLFPLSGTVEEITTRGLKYPLTRGTLKNGVQDGTSNQTVKKTVEIEFKKGDLLLLVNHE
jgi:thiamine pyrophosphokinase